MIEFELQDEEERDEEPIEESNSSLGK